MRKPKSVSDIKLIVTITSFIDQPLKKPTLTEAESATVSSLLEVTLVWAGCRPSGKLLPPGSSNVSVPVCGSVPGLPGLSYVRQNDPKTQSFSGNRNVCADPHLDRIN